jgi:hypothetical protein
MGARNGVTTVATPFQNGVTANAPPFQSSGK